MVMVPLGMSFIRSHKRILSDGTQRTYFARVENYWENGKVHQRVLEHLGTNPHARTFPLDASLATQVAVAFLQGKPSSVELVEKLKSLGLDIPGQPKQFNLTYTPPLKRYSLRCE